MALYSSKYINSLKVEDTTATIFKGQAWISIYVSGKKPATFKSYDDDDNLKGQWTVPANGTYSFKESKDGREWGKIEIDATDTVVEATFEQENIER